MRYYIGSVPFGQNDICHYGILGMKWGVRRYQNPDGTLTEEGKKRRITFVSGSSKTQDETSPYYRKKLPKEIRKELGKRMKEKGTILVGDAPGIDRQVQDYLNKKRYKNVEVYGPGKQVRYSANKKWGTFPIDAPQFMEMSKEWLAQKDIVMSMKATDAIAVILDEGASATRKNVQRMIEQNKDVLIYSLGRDKNDHWVDGL